MNLTRSGGRHPKPPLCSNKLYDVLQKCWDADPDGRPSFTQLCNAFKEMQTVSSKSADANAAQVEAAANDKLKRSSAANAYAGFGEERADPTCVMPENAGYIYEVPNCGVPNSSLHRLTLHGRTPTLEPAWQASLTSTQGWTPTLEPLRRASMAPAQGWTPTLEPVRQAPHER
jgi:hypothetical protein